MMPSSPTDPDSTSVPFIGRAKELIALDKALALALQGKTQVCLLAGEAGTGKTALLNEFATRAEESHPELIVATGECSDQTGASDPYLPFRDILAVLAGEIDTANASHKVTVMRAARWKGALKVTGGLLREFAPDVLGALLPGGALIAKAARVVADRADLSKNIERKIDESSGGGLSVTVDQNAILTQYAAALSAISREHPLLLMIDDLHWADMASITLLFHILRRAPDCHLLIVGAFRRSDLSLAREGNQLHPFETTLNTLKRYFGDVVVDVDAASKSESTQFVDALLALRPHQFPPAFSQALLAKTEGNPLFTIELLGEMEARGDIYTDGEGIWQCASELNWRALPARIEGVVAGRIERLAESLRETLTTASVEGVQFHAEIVGKVRTLSERALLDDLSNELERRYQLVQELGEEKVGRKVLSVFRFAQSVFQSYLYNALGRGQRRLEHGSVAAALEEMYSGRVEQVALQLAHHYEEARELDKASRYWTMAADKAMRISAFEEARGAYAKALAYADEAATDAEALMHRASVLLGLGTAQVRLGSYAEASEYLRDALAQARAADDKRITASALSEMCWVAIKQGQFGEARAHGEAALQAAQDAHDNAAQALAHRRLGIVQRSLRDYDAAVRHYESSRTLSELLKDQAGMIACLNNLANVAAERKDYAQASANYLQVKKIAEGLNNRQMVCVALGNLGEIARRRGQLDSASTYLHEAVELARRVGDRDLAISNTLNLGEVAEDRNDLAQARRLYTAAFAEARDINLMPRALLALAHFGLMHANAGNTIDAARWLGLVAAHEAADGSAKAAAAMLRSRLEVVMPADRLNVLVQEGSSLNLVDVTLT